MENQITDTSVIFKYDNGMMLEQFDQIVSEFPVTIFLGGEEFATMVCTPDNLEELIYGFLASEGVIRVYEDVKSLQIDEAKGYAYVELKNNQCISKEYHSKRFIGSCCGKSRQFYFHNDARTAKTSTSQIKLTPNQCITLMKDLQNSSMVFQETGGVHNAGLFSQDEMIINRADIGRHNALDKILGYCVINRIPVRDKIIAFSGRISSEVLLKAAKIGVGIILSKSAPTNLAIKLANDLNITAVGFIRGSSFNVYSHCYRITEK
ncbi:formate dehydrogenase family accessory protein FdhD [Bacillus sp. M6-12]|uniref:formate dehydrogenase accessory sulfurtransferase FdhD n=1 Tax=Bacillus sp. M6-12 TaxID=2054166 RepID=UPI000C761C5D|nr:formate dehydrogenase accessory sulfurtransferase FdhD [Bacillus sp. M6-12]PLS17243.1 formate dehydrogenase family accessory protein FdhD [Bacillus sp. M6-12]